ncbi:chemotaxis protein CheW [Rubellimicrobium rubrum]|uniref:Chemotaxis protein CheW n=1 Tax=Rubellimicrobium rubrum TaxID=2585369 RepID=A0A5C4N5T1_9RHOB|nr:chemotaxis protein CheW [Rubellimicrobium rubrum]TNC51999.1 chemotaxis protein CheW [Rubellimicrobium rubrum]
MTLMSRPASRSLGNIDVVTLRLGQDTLAIRAEMLREVLEPVSITRVPGAPEFCCGLVNVRGTVVPLSDLRVTFGMPRTPLGPDSRILVLDLPLSGRASVVGIVADAVHEVTRVESHMLQTVPAVGTRWPPQFIEAIARIGGNFVMLPDIPAIFAAFLGGQSATTVGPQGQGAAA